MKRHGVVAQRALAVLLFVSVGAGAQSVNTALSSVKVRPTDPVATNTTATIKAAKNEFESFQIVVTAPSGGLGSVSLNMPVTLTLDGGTATIPSSEIRAYREVYSYFNNASTLDGASGYWPDALAPYQDDGMAVCQSSGFTLCPDSGDRRTGAFPFGISGNQNGVIWIDVHVPLNQQPGLYRGTVTVTNGGSAIGQIAVNLTVRPFSIPSKSSLPSLFDIAIDQVCRAHGDVSGNYCPGVSDFHVWSNLYTRFFLDHRITLGLHDSLSGGTNYSGTFATYANDYGSLINGTDAYTRLPNAQVTTLKYPWWSYTDAQSTAQAKFLGWANGASGQGWFGLNLLYATTGSPGHFADEPGSNCPEWNNAIRAAQWAHSQNAGYRAMVTSGDYDDWAACGSSSEIDVLAPVLDWVDGKPNQASNGKNLSGEYQTFLAGSSRRSAWMYQSCDQSGCGTNSSTAAVNYPTFVADNSAIQNRAEPWMHYIYQMEGGMYYYDVAATLPTAWNYGNGIWNVDTWGNGQGTLVYPGTPTTVSGGSSFALGGNTHIPVASIRLKMLRDGMEDYEYLLQCEAATRSRSTALGIAENVFPMQGTDVNGNPHGSMYDVNNYNNSNQTDPKTLASVVENARESLANCIVNGTNPVVNVTPGGLGTGTVTSNPPGINCGTGGSTCQYAFPSNSQVTLNSTPDAGSTFSGYTGDCTGSTCTLAMNASKSVTANFAKPCNSSDCFNRPDSPNLGSNWNTYSPALQITSGQATNSDVNTKATQWVTSIGPDQDIAVDCKVTGPGSNCGLMGRWSDANNLYYAYLDAGLGIVDLWRVQAATATKIGSAARTIASNKYYHLRMLVQGSTISVYFNNEANATISVTDAALPTGNYAGLHVFAGAPQSVWYADFDVKIAGTQYYTVNVTKSGNGTGRVISSPVAIDCGTTCSAQVASGTSLRLDATPDSGSSFSGFTGGCTSSTTPCTFVVAANTTVNAAFATNDFSISASPSSATAPQGGTATYTVSTQVTSGAAQTVTFSASNLPSGATASFNPASVTAGGSSTMTVTVAASTPQGTYSNVNIVGTGTSTTHSVIVSLTVTQSSSSIVFRAQSTYVEQSTSSNSMNLVVPSSVQANDVMIATIFAGDYTSPSLPVVTAPQGWTLVRQATHGSSALLQIYSRVATASDAGTTYSWTTDIWVGAACSLVAYSGVNTQAPIDSSALQDNTTSSSTFSTPAVTTTAAGDVLLATYAGFSSAGSQSTWSTPSGMTQRVLANRANLRLALSNDDKTQSAAGGSGTYSATSSRVQDYAITGLVALRPSTAPAPISFRAVSTYSEQSTSSNSMNLLVPSSVQPGDVMIASIFAGDYTSPSLPVVTAPQGWTLVRQVSHASSALLQIYSRVAVATDAGITYSWTTNVWVGAACSLSAYSGASGVDVSAAVDNPSTASTYSTPRVTTTASGDLLFAIYAGFNVNGPTSSWSAPAGMTQRVFVTHANLRMALANDDANQSAAGDSGTFSSTANVSQSYALTALVALKR